MLKILKSIFKKKNINEDDYYSELFIKNPAWNTATPNGEELKRWQIIEEFLIEIKINIMPTQETNLTPNILDLGCGRGWLTSLLASYGRVTGIEPVKKVADYAKLLFPDIQIVHGTATDLINKGQTAYYDIIVCSEVIEHITDDNKIAFLLQIKSLLREKGFLIITTPRKDVELEWKRYTSPEQPIEDWITENSLADLFKRTSFVKHDLKRFSIPPSNEAPEIEIYQLWLVQNN
jgi:2-polyprenyl-3-methyl-5-hydroxy-6-metoxy-1,4-benzoquinol methylase